MAKILVYAKSPSGTNLELNCDTDGNIKTSKVNNKVYDKLVIFDTGGNQVSYTSTSVDYDGDVVDIDGYEQFLILCKIQNTVTNPGTFQILVSYDNITYWGLHTQSYSTSGDYIVWVPYYRINSDFDCVTVGVVIGKGWGAGFNAGNNTPFDNFGYKYLKIRMNISGVGGSIQNPFFEIVRMNRS